MQVLTDNTDFLVVGVMGGESSLALKNMFYACVSEFMAYLSRNK